MWKKYTNNEATKMTNSSGIYKTIYSNDSYLLLSGNPE